MNVLIIGAAGKTGAIVVEQAMAAGHVVTAFVRDATTYRSPANVRVVGLEALKARATPSTRQPPSVPCRASRRWCSCSPRSMKRSRPAKKGLIGGKRIDRPGSFMQPTILTDVAPDNPAFRSEFFGPVAMVFRGKDEAARDRARQRFRFRAGRIGLDQGCHTRSARGEPCRDRHDFHQQHRLVRCGIALLANKGSRTAPICTRRRLMD